MTTSTSREQASHGLSSGEAATILSSVGPNRLPEPPVAGAASRVVRQLRDPMIALLLVAAVLTLYLRDWPDSAIIAVVVVFNTSVGIAQELRAEHAMAALRQLVAPEASVVRDGAVVAIPTDEVVPGDLALVAAGDVLPADGVLVEAFDIQVDESPVTGESLPVPKALGAPLVGGTHVTRGHGTMSVTRTGVDSGIGRLAAELVKPSVRATPLQRRMSRLSRQLVAVVAALVVVVAVSGVLQGRSLSEMALVGLSLAVAAVPESLPAVVTISLALGARRMARRNAVMRNLPAVETLGSVTVVATDKTGTLTEGVMVAEELWVPLDPGRERDEALRRLLRDVVACNNARLTREDGAWVAAGEPLEAALLLRAAQDGQAPDDVARRWSRVAEVAFDPVSRRMTTRHRDAEGRELEICKGAPEAVAELVGGGFWRSEAAATASALADRGYRVMAVADTEQGAWSLAGLVGIGDRPRHQAADVVTQLGRAGVRVVMVTGDHPGTAMAIARRVGLGTEGRPAVGESLATMDASERSRVVVAARVGPEQKVALVEALQEDGEIVAMLGDGVNDAPALRRADIGVAAGLRGTEVAKEAADLVLLDDDLATVVAAIGEGRRIMANIRAFLVYAVAGGLAEVGVMLGGPVVGLGLPLLPGMILWTNLLTHGLVGVAFGGEPLARTAMLRPPRPPSESVFTPGSRRALVAAAVVLAVVSLLTGAVATGSLSERRTSVFVTLTLGQLGVALALRGRTQDGSRPLRGLDLAVLGACALLLVATYAAPLRDLLHTAPLGGAALAAAAVVAVAPGVVVRAMTARDG